MNKNIKLFYIIILILVVICFISGYMLGSKSNYETQKRIEQYQQEMDN